jgi:hypothetical protein
MRVCVTIEDKVAPGLVFTGPFFHFPMGIINNFAGVSVIAWISLLVFPKQQVMVMAQVSPFQGSRVGVHRHQASGRRILILPDSKGMDLMYCPGLMRS